MPAEHGSEGLWEADHSLELERNLSLEAEEVLAVKWGKHLARPGLVASWT